MNIQEAAEKVRFGRIVINVHEGKAVYGDNDVYVSVKPQDNADAVARMITHFKDINDEKKTGSTTVTYNYSNGQIKQIIIGGYEREHYSNDNR